MSARGSGRRRSPQGYYPWGETRFGSLETEYQFTGQYRLAALGLDYFNARWYDPMLGRWTSPDTIVPDPGNPADFDRYSYVRNNPINYNDPSGHKPCSDFGCPDDSYDPIELATGIQTDPQTKRFWPGLTAEEQAFLSNAGWSEGSFNDFMLGGNAKTADIWHDPLFYLELLIVGRGLVRASIRIQALIVLPQLQIFRSGGEKWHLGLETKDHMSIIHVGNDPKYGIHIAFGAVKPFVADFHIYLMKSFPFFRTWRPK